MDHRICLFLCISSFPVILSQNYRDNTITKDEYPNNEQNEIRDTNPFEDAATQAADFLQNANAMGDLGDMVSGFLQSGGGKAMENVLMGAMQNPDTAGQILSGIGSMMQNNKAGAALDPSLMANMLSLVASSQTNEKHKKEQDPLGSNVIGLLANMLTQQNVQKNSDTMDILGTVANTISNAFTDAGENPLALLMSSINSFIGPDADKREHAHESHAFLLPPLLEKAHLYFDHFRHTELYKSLWKITGADKIFQIFAVDGKFNFTKFFDRLENKNFRKHWIHVVTKRMTDLIAFVTDSSRYEKYIHTVVSLFNGFLKTSNFPKSTLFDTSRPEETLTKFFNYFLKKYLSLDMESSQYVVPAVKYVKDILHMAHDRGYLVRDGLDSNNLAQKLTDTINLEIIEPILRVWRAYRFAKNNPECDKYVMCLINQENPEEKVSLPGLKIALSKSASMYASWFLSSKTGTSFWTLYSTIHDESDCSVRFLEKCNEFHIEETKVESEYTHTEL